jgi:hypothetical protein
MIKTVSRARSGQYLPFSLHALDVVRRTFYRHEKVAYCDGSHVLILTWVCNRLPVPLLVPRLIMCRVFNEKRICRTSTFLTALIILACLSLPVKANLDSRFNL